MKYRGFWNRVNKKPESGEWIELWASDWNKDHWGFYAFIRADHYKEDIEAINALIQELNWRDGDVYVELINHSENFKEFYDRLYQKGYLAHWDTLRVEKWEEVKTILTECVH